MTAVHAAPGDFPGGKKGDELTVEFAVLGIPCLGLNGGSTFKHSEAISFQIATEDQEETDRYWNAIVGNGGAESQCGWCKDRWGISWQISPRALTEAVAAGGDEAKRAFEAMMTMKKIDIAPSRQRGEADADKPHILMRPESRTTGKRPRRAFTSGLSTRPKRSNPTLRGTRPSSQCRPDRASDLRKSPTSARRISSD